ncbi:histidine kinase [Paenibacillus validus]|uniref:histidine kinase n=1 Tax=Paenibacillus validus TaxID=44253 RepID=UPI000FD76B89|nr:histidine kinase [Paenibacillus validus]MED4603918.1 histidine kinase [Paenibacillus validus]MED4609419.1 histidine kinase [Paenibacillus validus]
MKAGRWRRKLLDTWRGKSIQFIITASFTLITLLVMIVVSGILYNKFSGTAEQNAFLSNEQIVEQVKYNLEIYLQNMAQVFEKVDSKVRAGDAVSKERLLEQIGTILETRSDVVSMGLFGEDGTLINGLPAAPMRANTRLTEQSWFRAALENPNHLTFSLPHVQNLYKGEYKWVVSMSKGIKINREGRTYNAVLLVDVNFRTIDDLLRRVSLGKKGYVYIIDDSAGNIVYHPQQQLIYAGLKYENVEQALKYTFGNYVDSSSGEKRLITIKTVNNIGWKIIGVSYMDEIVTTRKEIGTFISWLLLFVIVFVLLISAFMSARISMPIKRLERSMRKVEQGDFDIHLEVQGEDEVGRLSRRFNFMVVRIRELMGQIIHEQEAKRKGELEVLQAQINPHFLYNTLNSVVRMAGSGKSEEVITMITSLSKFFRISLSKGKHIIPVQDELEHVRHYLIIQKMRYKRKFDFVIEADDEVLAVPTLKLILQPIVENAIYHAMEIMVDDGLIEIAAERLGSRVRLQVRDNGPGIPPDKLERLLSGDARSDEGSGVGVKNVHERIRLHFGESYGLEIESKLEVGTTVTLWIPFDSGREGAGV